MPPEHIISVSDLVILRESLSEKTIVLATGCFDILHVGHLYFLRDAAMQGGVLVVGVNSDRTVRLIKGVDRPIVRQDERVELIAAFRCVDYAFIYDDTVADDVIIHLKPDIFAMGEESVRGYPSESATAKQIGAEVYVVDRIPTSSTTSILTSIQRKLKD